MKNRRKFIGDSAKIAGAMALASALPLVAKDSKANPKDLAQDSNKNKKGTSMEYLELNNGVKMPLLGYGTYQIPNNEAQRCVEDAISVGYRLIDTAQAYANEEGIGAALKTAMRGGIKRDELFIETKLWISHANEKDAIKAFEASLKKLGLDYIDLYIIHQPFNDTYGAWRAMSTLYKDKAVRAIGVSNFNPARIMDFVQNNEIKPAVNQIECHPHFQNEKALQNLKELGIQMEAFSPLKQARDNILNDKILSKIAKAHKKSVAQVILRWVYQRGIVSVAKTTKPTRMRENLNIFDFELTSADMAKIAKLETGKPLLDHQDPARIKWFNERTAGENFKG